MIFKQIRSTDGTGTLSYLLAEEQANIAAIVDPNLEDVETITGFAEQRGVRITHVVDTHTHADHLSGAGELKKLFGAEYVMHENTRNKWKTVDKGDKFGIGDTLRANARTEVDRYVNDGDAIAVGSLKLAVLFTPGHTDNHITLSLMDNLFTGDLLLIGQAGRSDLPGGNPGDQYDSLYMKVLPLPDMTKIYPGHDYAERSFSYLRDEKISNPFLQRRTKQEYVEFVTDFFPPLAESVEGGKMTLQCGTTRVTTSDTPFRNITPQELAAIISENPSLFLLDVREPFELVTFGAIPGVKNIPVGQITQKLNELPSDKLVPIVAICQRGNRSREVAHYLWGQGYKNVLNLVDGTGGWVKSGNPVTRHTVSSPTHP